MADRYYLGGVTNTVLHVESDGVIHVEERQDSQGILDRAARLRNERFAGGSGEFQEEFNVPMVLLIKWQHECGHPMFSDEHMEYVDRQLRSPEYAYIASAPKLRDPSIIINGAR